MAGDGSNAASEAPGFRSAASTPTQPAPLPKSRMRWKEPPPLAGRPAWRATRRRIQRKWPYPGVPGSPSQPLALASNFWAVESGARTWLRREATSTAPLQSCGPACSSVPCRVVRRRPDPLAVQTAPRWSRGQRASRQAASAASAFVSITWTRTRSLSPRRSSRAVRDAGVLGGPWTSRRRGPGPAGASGPSSSPLAPCAATMCWRGGVEEAAMGGKPSVLGAANAASSCVSVRSGRSPAPAPAGAPGVGSRRTRRRSGRPTRRTPSGSRWR